MKTCFRFFATWLFILNVQEHLENCEYGDILCINDCGAKFQKRFLQKHLDKDCPKKIIACSYCDERHLREDKKEHMQECPKIPLPCPNKCDKTLNIPRDEVSMSFVLCFYLFLVKIQVVWSLYVLILKDFFLTLIACFEFQYFICCRKKFLLLFVLLIEHEIKGYFERKFFSW